jgi:hypothetical protein
MNPAPTAHEPGESQHPSASIEDTGGTTAANKAIAAPSFTRFVLPFCWRPTPCQTEPTSAYRHVKPAPPVHPPEWNDAWLTIPEEPQPHLHSYFIKEVRDLVYEHAAWFILDGAGEKYSPPGAPGKGSFMLRPAGLILFEIESALNAQTHDQGVAGDCHGLLIIQTESAPDDPPDIERWLFWNEHYRNFKSPYPAAGEKAALLRGLGDDVAGVTRQWLSLLRHPVEYAGRFYHLLPAGDSAADGMAFPFTDGRSFVWSALWHGDEGLQKSIVTWGLAGGPLPESLGAWIKHLNVDSAGDDLSGSSCFEREWGFPLTYRRWAHTGTLYGFTPHSGALLSRAPADYLAGPFRESHFTMIVILLYTRLRLAELGKRLNRHARELADGRADRKAVEAGFAALRRDYLVFTNLVYFQQVSNQQQAQEMFPLARQAMGIQAVYEELTREIEGTGAWLVEQAESQQADAEFRLNILAACGVVAALTLALWDLCGGWEIDESAVCAGESGGRWTAVLVAFALFIAGAGWIMRKPLCRCFRSSRFCKDQLD